MNGIVSQNMRNLGANYKINFGLTLPLLKKNSRRDTGGCSTGKCFVERYRRA